MRPRSSLLVGAALFTAPCWAHGDGPPLTSSLKYKAAPKWSVILPNETWTPVTGGIPIAHDGGSQFAAFGDGKSMKLEVDTNGDGKPDAMVKGANGYLVLSGKTQEGTPLSYAARFKADGNNYKFASSGWMQGALDGVAIRLIDQNNNGVYGEFGVDAMVVGNGNAASYLSKVVSLKGSLYELSVEGDQISASPYTGETGTLNLAKGFASSGKLAAAVVRSDDGKTSFELADGAMAVPVGRYRIAGGMVTKANETVRIGAGKCQAIEVTTGQEATLDWGSDVVAEFNYSVVNGEITIQPNALRFFGRAGEEYLEFLPEGASPKFGVHDAATGKLLKTGRFGGC
jgi:hypothetical protein